MHHWITPKINIAPVYCQSENDPGGQNDMNKSIIAPPCSSMRELEGGKLHIHLRGQETSAYFHFAPWPLPDSEGHQKRHFIRIIMEQRGVGGFFAPNIDLVLFESR